MARLEKEIERKLVKMIERHGGLCLKWVCPGWVGVPDRIILMPGGRVIFAELKRPQGGKLSRMQEWWLGRLRRMGFHAVTVWDEDDIKRMEVMLLAV